MDAAPGPDDPSVESELVRTFRYIDLWLQQKTDLFLQHYVFDPFEFLARQVLLLSVITTLLAAGTVILVIGIVFFIATMIPLWAALILSAVIILAIGGGAGYILITERPVLKTPVAGEMMKNGKP